MSFHSKLLQVDQQLGVIRELIEIDQALENMNVASSCNYLSTPSDTACTMNPTDVGEFYEPSPYSSDMDNLDSDEDVGVDF
jgi:hypothetical protein